MNIRVGIVDDHNIICDGIRTLIEYHSDYKVVFQACSGNDCLTLIDKPENLIDILLLDIDMPGKNGYDVLQLVQERYYNIKIIFLTSYNDYEHFSRAMNFHVDGYLLKNGSFIELLSAIREVHNGLSFIDNRLFSLLEQYIRNIDSARLKVTEREKEILTCVASGMINKEIASNLNISEETVKSHLSRIFRKFDVSDRTEAVTYAVKNHYLIL